MFTPDRFHIFYNLLKNDLPEFNIKYKDKSLLMKILSKILFFNNFNEFITTIKYDVYFPSEQFVEKDPKNSIIILSHEFVHAKDAQKYNPIIFSFLYLFPQILFIPSLLLLFIHPLFILLSLIFLLPLPAFFRMNFETRGYIMSLYMTNEILKELSFSSEKRKEILYRQAKSIDEKYFKGWAYYKMWPFGVLKYLNTKIDEMIVDDSSNEKFPYSEEIKKSFKKSNF